VEVEGQYYTGMQGVGNATVLQIGRRPMMQGDHTAIVIAEHEQPVDRWKTRTLPP
jgi:hypothetical protein